MRPILRRLDSLRRDPVLRRWLVRRAFQGTARRDGQAGRPPYLGLPPSEASVPPDRSRFGEMGGAAAFGARTIELPGLELAVDPSTIGGLFERSFADLEQYLALQRFAWLALEPRGDPALVQAMWQAWKDRFAQPRAGWAWHPYSAGERALNLLRFARQSGLPAPADETHEILREHARWIRRNLEYYGECATGNHLANNGRALYVLGLELGLPAHADDGATILRQERHRLFLPSGVLREGSSHYHLLVTRFYLECWLGARRFARPEAEWLEDACRMALGAARTLKMPARLPLVGDISPDCPPEYLASLVERELPREGWLASLDDTDYALVRALAAAAPSPSREVSARDGWIRWDKGAWSCLAYASPQGWPFVPGHSHQDFGSFEAHCGDTSVCVDLGRGWYGEGGGALEDWSARAHTALLVDGHGPYPANKPYYDEPFRTAVAGGPPDIHASDASVMLAHDGFTRMKGVRTARRTLAVEGDSLIVRDEVGGEGRHIITRLFHTPLTVRQSDAGTVTLESPQGRRWRLQADGAIAVRPATVWTAYGRGGTATTIEIVNDGRLPWEGRVCIEALT